MSLLGDNGVLTFSDGQTVTISRPQIDSYDKKFAHLPRLELNNEGYLIAKSPYIESVIPYSFSLKATLPITTAELILQAVGAFERNTKANILTPLWSWQDNLIAGASFSRVSNMLTPMQFQTYSVIPTLIGRVERGNNFMQVSLNLLENNSRAAT